MSKKNRGFTLAELLVVIAIIGILSAMIVANVSDSRKKARDAKRKADLKSIQTALELYANVNSGKFPTTFSELVPTYLSELKDANGKNCIGATLCDYTLSNILCNGTAEGNYHYSLRSKLEMQKDPDMKDCGGQKVYVLEQ